MTRAGRSRRASSGCARGATGKSLPSCSGHSTACTGPMPRARTRCSFPPFTTWWGRRRTASGKQATWLLALQQDGADGHWLGFYRSDDEARSWRWYAPIQDQSVERDTPDLLAVGMDVALVYSYEGPTLSGSVLHDVYFQW